MATITKAITLFVLFSLFLLSQSLQDPSTSLSLSSSESGSESTTVVGSENQEPDRTVVFNPSDLDAPHVDPDLIADSFRLPNHHHHRRLRRHVHHRHHADDDSIRIFRGFGGVRPRVEFPAEMKEFEPKEEMRRREDRDGDESDDEDEIEHKRMKKMMKRMRRFRKEEEEERGWGFVDRVRHFVNHLL